MQSPSDLGYRMPAEWEPHARTWMGWPERPDNWREGAKPAQEAFAAVVKAISQFEPVTVCCNPSQLATATAALIPHPNIEVIEVAQDDAWFRDTGPTFIINERQRSQTPQHPSPGSTIDQRPLDTIAGVDWDFNAWGGATGGLYASWERDRVVASKILSRIGVRRFNCPIVLEGGSIHVDGEGTLLTTEECLLNSNRNPELNKEQIEGWLKTMLGVKKVIWLPRGLYGDDDTNGHIDNFACFARPGVVLLAWTDDSSEEQYQISVEALQILENATDAKGRKLEVIKVPLPKPMFATTEDVRSVQVVKGVKLREEGLRLAGSYVNFYICNGGVVMPGLGDAEADASAMAVLQKAFPNRKVVQVPTREVLLGGGNIHCITQQQPAG